jgi:hypothetical protein
LIVQPNRICMRYCLLSAMLILVLNTSAQTRKSYKINPGEKIIEVIPFDEIYRYNPFKLGTVYLRNGVVSQAYLNYNALYSEIQFLDQKGDTFSLADKPEVKEVVIGRDSFYFDKGYVRLKESFGDVKLGEKEFFAFANRQKIGGFGELTNASIDNYNAATNGNIYKDLVVNEVITLVKYTFIYIGDNFNHYKVVNKKNLLEVYNKKQNQLQRYLDANKVNYNSEEDIRKLIIAMAKEELPPASKS